MTLDTYLKANGIKQADFASLIGVDQSAVSRLARGSIPSQEVMARIFDATGGQVRADDFFGLPTTPAPAPTEERAA